MKYKLLFFSLMLIIITTIGSCNKYLDEKSDKSLAKLSTLDDLQAILDNTGVIQTGFASAGEVSSTDYYITDASYDGLSKEEDRNMYIWKPDHIFSSATTATNEWQACYTAIYTCNSVLKALSEINDADYETGRNIKAQALFWRSFRYFDAAQIWCLPFDSATIQTDLGLPLRMDPDFNEISKRSTIQQTYDQILKDIKESIPMLPLSSLNAWRPSKAAGYGLLSRIYLTIRDYKNAGLYADSCLNLANSLMDFNTLDTFSESPIQLLNPEVIINTGMWSSDMPLYYDNRRVDTVLYNLYDNSDLRKKIFFTKNMDGSLSVKGSYYGDQYSNFTGIATDEIFLIRAECNAREGNINLALDDLNILLRKRWKVGTFEKISTLSLQDVLNIILKERQKELFMRGLRWQDIRRLNMEGANIIMIRTVGGNVYTLQPNDLRYALAIPEDIISLSGMKQNPR